MSLDMDIFWIAILAGLANWAFRALPTMLMTSQPTAGSILSKFLASTGPAAIATLFVGTILPEFYPEPRHILPLVLGVLATVLAFLPHKSVVVATLSGSVVYGFAYWFTM